MTARFMIAGTHSGVGKTSVALGLSGALRQKGLIVRSLKAGPDFLDAAWLGTAAGHPPRNVDAWMAGSSLPHVFAHATQGADIVLVEGMMGLFDGVNPANDEGSSAHLAKLLGLPVILVVDASAMARSVAALVKGFQTFDPTLQLAGIIANRVGGDSHSAMIREALAPLGIPLLGSLPRMEASLPERHLGLVSPDSGASTGLLESLALHMGAHTDLLLLEKLARTAPALLESNGDNPFTTPSAENSSAPHLKVAIARDAAFNFYYEDNLDLLRIHGAELVPFSPLNDEAVPEGCLLMLLGGGYPEEHVRELSSNNSMLQSIRSFASRGRIYAECGGLMLLTRHINTLEGTCHPMVGLVESSAVMGSRIAQIGYRHIGTLGPWLGGHELRGHEFHYSHLDMEPQSPACLLRHPRTGHSHHDGFATERLFATYAHLYWPGNKIIKSILFSI